MTRSFGEYIEGKSFKVLDERTMRISAGVMFLFGLTAFINGFVIKDFRIIPYISGFLLLNFLIGLFINPKYSPTVMIASMFVKNKTPKYIGAIQKKFAWGLGLVLATAIFVMSILLQTEITFYAHTCFFCLVCLALLFFETVFGVCAGCELYFFAIDLKLIPKPKPEDKPNCMGDSCDV